MLAPTAVQAERVTMAEAEASDAYAFATTSHQKNGAIFMQLITNPLFDEKLIKAETDIAARVEMHTHLMDGDKMQMRQVESFSADEYGLITLRPHGDHVMLFDLKAPLKVGDTFPLTLTLAHAGVVTIEVKVIAPGTSPKPHVHNHNSDMEDHDHNHDMHMGHTGSHETKEHKTKMHEMKMHDEDADEDHSHH